MQILKDKPEEQADISHEAENAKVIAGPWLQRALPARARPLKADIKRNVPLMVAGVVYLAFLVLVRQFATIEFTILIGAVILCAAAMFYELSTRRRWEERFFSQTRRLNEEYARLVREVARNRNELSDLKRGLASVGTPLQADGTGIEDRMVKGIIRQLNRLGDAPRIAKNRKKAADQELSAEKLDFITDEAALETLSDEQVTELMSRAVEYDQIDVFIQPIVNLPQRKVRFYEMLSRIRVKTDIYLPAKRYIKLARHDNLLPAIDNLLLLRGLQLVRDGEDQQTGQAYFCNIESQTLNDPRFMGDLVEFIAQYRGLASKLVFELAQADIENMDDEIAPILDGLSQLGCRFSMDRVQSLKMDFKQLEARHIRFLKIDAKYLLQELDIRGGLRRLKNLKNDLDRIGIDLIVSKIETDQELLSLLDIEIDYGQGFLFGHPEICTELD